MSSVNAAGAGQGHQAIEKLKDYVANKLKEGGQTGQNPSAGGAAPGVNAVEGLGGGPSAGGKPGEGPAASFAQSGESAREASEAGDGGGAVGQSAQSGGVPQTSAANGVSSVTGASNAEQASTGTEDKDPNIEAILKLLGGGADGAAQPQAAGGVPSAVPGVSETKQTAGV